MKTSNLQRKRALFILLVCLVGMAKAMAQSFTVEDLNYSVNDDGTSVTLTGHVNGTSATGSLVIPESVNYEGTAYAVTAIGWSAFSQCSELSGSLIIPNSVTEIGGSAFNSCSGFTGNLTIGNSVLSIGSSAFVGCSGFTEVHFNATNCSDVFSSNLPFAGCGGLLIIGVNVERIPAHMFENGSFNGTLTIPNSVTEIGTDAFRYCSGFTGDLVIPRSISTIRERTFGECSGFSGNLIIPEGVTSIGFWAFENCNGFHGDLVIPSTVTSIGDNAFTGCSGFSNVFYNAINCANASHYSTFGSCGGTITIGENVERIPDNLFMNAAFAGDLIIPNSVTSIGNAAFSGCSGFTGDLEIPESVVFIGTCAFSNCSGFSTVHYNARNCQNSGSNLDYFDGCGGTLILGDNVESIPSAMFKNSNFIGSVTIGNSVTSIGEVNPFSGCSLLEQIIVDPLNTVYDSREDCNAIIRTSDNTLLIGCQNTYIPDSVTSITSHAFQNLSTLTSINIPNTVTSIGEQAFLSCTCLTTMTILAETPPYLYREVFSDVPKDIPVYVPCYSVGEYQSESGWNEFTNYIEAPPYRIRVETNEPDYCTVSIMQFPSCEDSQAIVKAEPITGYTFVAWEENGVEVSTDSVYTFTVDRDIHLLAKVKPNTGVSESVEESIAVYPNPTNGKVRIEAENIKNVAVYNLMGQRLFEAEVYSDEFEYDFTQHSEGLYFVRIETANGVVVRRVTVIDS